MKHSDQVSYFNQLFTLSVEGPSVISQWIETNLLKATTIDREALKAFFEAEQEIINQYIDKKEPKKLSRLITEFTKLNNLDINKIQLGILRKILKERQEHSDFDPQTKKCLIEAFKPLKNFIDQTTDEAIRTSWSIVKDILADSLEDLDQKDERTIKPETNFIQALETLPPKHYLRRYESIFEIYKSIIDKALDTKYLTILGKTEITNPHDLIQKTAFNVYDELETFEHNLKDATHALQEDVEQIKKKPKLDAIDSNILILNHAIEGCLLSLDPFLDDLKPLSHHLDSYQIIQNTPSTPDIPVAGGSDEASENQA